MKYILVVIMWYSTGLAMVFDNKQDCQYVLEQIETKNNISFIECIQVTTL